MALLFCDSFDHYATAQIGNKYTTSNNGAIGAYGRNSTNGLRFAAGTGFVAKTCYVTRVLPSTYTTLYAGFSVKPSSLDDSSYLLFGVLEDATLHVDIRIQSATGKVVATRNGTVLGTSANAVFAVNEIVHIQVKIYIHDSGGTVDVLANGVSVLSVSSVDTKNGGTGVANTFKLGGIVGNADFDDFWIDDSEYLGDCRIECLFPTGAGDTTAWTPSAGDNYECVDETAPDSDTSYVSSDTADQVDTYAFGNLATTAGTIKGVQVLGFARKDDAGSRSVALVARPVSTDRVGDTASVGDSYSYVRQVWELNPEDSAVWEIADVNGAKFGVKLVS